MSDATRMPLLFVGHGSPMLAIQENPWSPGWAKLATTFPKPKAIVAVSAHWYVHGTHLTADDRPPTIHDFGGFPRALYEISYRAPGQPDLAKRVAKLLGAPEAQALRTGWGLDHGTWSVLMHMYPKADIPVIQLSVNRDLRPRQHYELGRSLAPLREQGVLVLASGNLTHNLRHAMAAFAAKDPRSAPTPQWAAEFDHRVVQALEQQDSASLIVALDDEVGRLSHPSPDHYLPLLYAAAAAAPAAPSTGPSPRVTFPVTGWDAGSLSMRSIRFD